MSQLKQVGRKGANPSFLCILFYSGLQGTGWCLPTWGRAIHFTEITNSNGNLIWNSQTHPEMFNLDTPWLSQVDTQK